MANAHTNSNTPLTFFKGQTFDGHRWVLAFEGGPTATSPERRGMVSGRVGPALKVLLTVAQGSELRALLPALKLSEVREELRALR